VAIPKELAERMNLRVGDQVYFFANDDEPGTINIVPVEMVATWIGRGRRASKDASPDSKDTQTEKG
jgi:bifunctional DNA-binding transcriptional regulator/antitoxin component of YhaV-PrlF toxin-antitoxin module